MALHGAGWVLGDMEFLQLPDDGVDGAILQPTVTAKGEGLERIQMKRVARLKTLGVMLHDTELPVKQLMSRAWRARWEGARFMDGVGLDFAGKISACMRLVDQVILYGAFIWQWCAKSLREADRKWWAVHCSIIGPILRTKHQGMDRTELSRLTSRCIVKARRDSKWVKPSIRIWQQVFKWLEYIAKWPEGSDRHHLMTIMSRQSWEKDSLWWYLEKWWEHRFPGTQASLHQIPHSWNWHEGVKLFASDWDLS